MPLELFSVLIGRSPSPRFDPSQYVKDKARKQREVDLRRSVHCCAIVAKKCIVSLNLVIVCSLKLNYVCRG